MENNNPNTEEVQINEQMQVQDPSELQDPGIVDIDALKDILVDVPDEKIDEWKKAGYDIVFKLDFMRDTYIYRSFNYIEYKELRNDIRVKFKDDVESGDEAFKEALQNKCVLWPLDYVTRLETGKPKQIPAGIAFLLGDYILASSGFADSIVPDVIPLTQE